MRTHVKKKIKKKKNYQKEKFVKKNKIGLINNNNNNVRLNGNIKGGTDSEKKKNKSTQTQRNFKSTPNNTKSYNLRSDENNGITDQNDSEVLKPSGDIDHNKTKRKKRVFCNYTSVSSDEEAAHTLHKLEGKRLVLIRFYADWCGHCAEMQAAFFKVVSCYSHVAFVDVDVDVCQNTSELYKVTCLPSFVFTLGGVSRLSYCGSDAQVLKGHIEKFLCGGAVQRGKRLTSEIDKSRCDGLNMSQDSCLLRALKHNTLTYQNKLNKDTDIKEHIFSNIGPQILLTIAFYHKVNLGSFSIKAPPDCGPKLVSLYYNVKHNVDFELIKSIKAHDIYQFSREDLIDGKKKELTHGYSDVCNKIHIYIQSNRNGTNQTRLSNLSFFFFEPKKLKKIFL